MANLCWDLALVGSGKATSVVFRFHGRQWYDHSEPPAQRHPEDGNSVAKERLDDPYSSFPVTLPKGRGSDNSPAFVACLRSGGIGLIRGQSASRFGLTTERLLDQNIDLVRENTIDRDPDIDQPLTSKGGIELEIELVESDKVTLLASV